MNIERGGEGRNGIRLAILISGAARRRIGDFDASRHRQDGIRRAEGKSADQRGCLGGYSILFDVVICLRGK